MDTTSKVIIAGVAVLGGYYLLSGKRTVAVSYTPTAPDYTAPNTTPNTTPAASQNIYTMLNELWNLTTPGMLWNQFNQQVGLPW